MESMSMVATSTVIGIFVTLFISLLLPIIVYVVYGLANKGKGVWTAWLLGAAGFFIMQILVRLPILNILSVTSGYQNFVQEHYVLYCFLLALTAGLFEVIARYAVAKIMSKKLTFQRGIAAGLGHGGIEAIVIIGLTYINNITYIIMINTGYFDKLVQETAAMGIDTSNLIMMRDTLIGTSPVLFYLAGYERILTMIAHTAMSLLVCYFVWKKKDLLGIVLCLVIHSTVDFLSVIFNSLSTEYLGSVVSPTTGYVLVYAFLTVAAALLLLMIGAIRKRWRE